MVRSASARGKAFSDMVGRMCNSAKDLPCAVWLSGGPVGACWLVVRDGGL